MPRFRRASVGLAVDSPDRDIVRRERPLVSPTGAALLGGAAVAIAGYLLALGVSALAWIQDADDNFATPARAAASVWLLAHGAKVTMGGLPVSVVPLGFTGVIVLMATGASGFAATQRRIDIESTPAPGDDHPEDDHPEDDHPEDDHPEDTGPEDKRPEVQGTERGEVLRLCLLFAAGYLACVLVVGGIAAGAPVAARAVPGAIVVAGASAFIGGVRGLRWRPWRSWPAWLQAVPAATASALLVLAVGSSLVAGFAFSQHWRKVSHLQTALQPGVSGGVALLVLQLVYLPNFIIWAGSWMLGAGVSIGQGSVISPVTTQLGLMPSIPAFGALPPVGVGSGRELWWLLVGVAAGGVAAAAVSFARRRARFDEVALVGGLAGVACGLLAVVVGWLSSGALGSARLVSVGPRLAQLVVLAPTTLGLAGLVTGAAIGLLRRPATKPGASASDDRDDPSLVESDDGTEMSFR